MEAKELMIGDWVKLEDARIGNTNFVGPVVQIKSITGRHVLIPNSKGLLEDVTEEHLLPIPFTYEILEKNGFKPLEEDSFVCKELSDIDDYIIVVDLLVPYLSYIEKHKTPKSRYSGEIKYVHQLQHILRLCGIDKKIKLEE